MKGPKFLTSAASTLAVLEMKNNSNHSFFHEPSEGPPQQNLNGWQTSIVAVAHGFVQWAKHEKHQFVAQKRLSLAEALLK